MERRSNFLSSPFVFYLGGGKSALSKLKNSNTAQKFLKNQISLICMEDKAIIPLLEEAVGYVSNHGKVIPDKPYDFDTGMSGSDAASVRARGTIKSLQRNGFEIRLNDNHVSRSSGTYSVDWSEVDNRTLEMYLDGDRIVQAERCLGGERGWSGMLSSERSKIEATDWNIKKSDSLDEVAKYLVEIRESLS